MTWTVVYAHDVDGTRTDGNLDQLIQLVEDGYPIRFAMLESYGTAVADAQWVYVRNGTVYAENTANISDGFQDDRLIFQDDAYHWYVTVSTKGDRDMSRWKVGEHAPGGPGHTRDRISLRWFAEL
jgi:hypothetical protein